MKKVFLFTMLLFLTVSRWCYADKILISGNPIILENQGSGYVVPKDSIIMTSYYYVLLNGEKQVCFIDKQPALSALNIKL